MSQSKRYENKKMAIINITCDYPFEYTHHQLSKWAKLSLSATIILCKTLDLDIVAGTKGKAKKPISGMRKYIKF